MLRFALLVLTLATPAWAQPRVDASTVAAFVDQPLTITGSGFGPREASSHLAVTQGSETRRIAATAGEIVEWTDRTVVVRLPPGARSGRLRIESTAGYSRDVRLDVYRYDWFDIPPTANTNALPLAIARAADGTLWINQEFHLDLQRV